MSTKRRFCEVCQSEIEAERIEGESKTRLCAKHAHEIQKYGGEFIGTGARSSIGKTGSLKMNYGDVTVTWQRNDDGLRRLIEDFEREKWEQKKA